jgi:hypothetical protein
MLVENQPNVHSYHHDLKSINDKVHILIVPDIHFDNPKCRRDILKKDLDEALEKNARILIPGDLFCLMQGRYDPRKSKGDILPQHNVDNYIDAVVEEAVEWFKPYAENIDVVGYGNHETNILKRIETNVIERFVSMLNFIAKPESKVCTGGYGGWYIVRTKNHGRSLPYNIKYFHGSGGGAPVTKGTIQHNRMSTYIQNADAIVMGHVHNDYEVTYSVELFDNNLSKVKHKDVVMLRCSTYKDEYFNLKAGPGSLGWHIERGAAPKPIGGRWLELNYTRVETVNKPAVHSVKGRSYRTSNS